MLKPFKIIIVAPTCFGLHKPSSGSSQPVLHQSYNVDFGYIYIYCYMELSALWLQEQLHTTTPKFRTSSSRAATQKTVPKRRKKREILFLHLNQHRKSRFGTSCQVSAFDISSVQLKVVLIPSPGVTWNSAFLPLPFVVLAWGQETRTDFTLSFTYSTIIKEETAQIAQVHSSTFSNMDTGISEQIFLEWQWSWPRVPEENQTFQHTFMLRLHVAVSKHL